MRSADAMSPAEYRDWLIAQKTRRQLKLWARSAPQSGLMVEVDSGIPVLRVVDEGTYREYLADQGQSPEEVERTLALEASMSEQDWVNSVRRYRGRLESILKWAMGLLGKRGERVAGIPLGVAPIPLLNAGAAPVPSGGDVLIFASGLSHVALWLRVQVLALGNDGEGHVIDRPPELGVQLLRSMPDLARAIMQQEPSSQLLPITALVRDHWEGFPRAEFERRDWLAEGFVVLHELAHVILGHTDRLRVSEPKWADDPDELLRRRAEARQFEHEADAFAASVMRNCTEGPDELAAISGIFSMFRFAEAISPAADPFARHPPALARHRIAARSLHVGALSDEQLDDLVEFPRQMAYQLGGG